jgi:hypothetical protein
MLLFVVSIPSASAQVHKSNEFVFFFGPSVTLNGNPLPVGGLIDAYDPDDLRCGTSIVSTAGQYVATAVYRDDFTTPEHDGADPGDAISFKINGVSATAVGPDDAIWTQNGDWMEVNLSVSYTIALALKPPMDGIGSPSSFTDYTFYVMNTGEGIDFCLLEASSASGWAVNILGANPSGYVNPGDSIAVVVRVHVPSGALPDETDVMTFSVKSAMDNSVTVSAPVTTTVSSSAADDFNPVIPGVFKLSQNYPNPFNPTTTIDFTLERSMDIDLSVYNVIGQKVATLVSGQREIGSYSVIWNGADDSGNPIASGIYFYRLTTEQYSRTCKMMLMK